MMRDGVISSQKSTAWPRGPAVAPERAGQIRTPDASPRRPRAVIDLQNSAAVNGGSAILKPSDAKTMLRERWLLYVQCIESKTGHEPANPYLYGRYA